MLSLYFIIKYTIGKESFFFRVVCIQTREKWCVFDCICKNIDKFKVVTARTGKSMDFNTVDLYSSYISRGGCLTINSDIASCPFLSFLLGS